MPVKVSIKNEISGTSGSPKNMSGVKTLTVVVEITAVETSTDSLQPTPDKEAEFAESGTGNVAAAMIAEAVGTTITKVFITAGLQNGTSASDFLAGAGTSAGVGVKEFPVTLNITNGDARFNQVCKLVPHAVATGGDNGDFTGTALNFINII